MVFKAEYGNVPEKNVKMGLANAASVWYNGIDIDGQILPFYGGCYEIIVGTTLKYCARR